MNVIDSSFQSNYYPNSRFYKISGPLTEEDINTINRISTSTFLVFENTRDLNPTLLRKINNPNVKISITGGLDYYRKKKFNASNYIERTIYKPNDLASIIEVFQKIENKIRYTWTPRQKVMYVYQSLCESLHYCYDDEDDYEDGKDIARSLNGVLYGRLVCSGFALVFKEMMDRIGVPCLYQNKSHSHSWNVVTLDGKNYAMDLTWDCYHKDNNTCGFRYFGLDPNFYQNRHHDISHDIEETMLPLSTFTIDELREDYKQIAYGKAIEKREMVEVPDSDGKLFYNLYHKDKDGIYHYFVCVYGQMLLIHTKKAPEQLQVMDVFEAIEHQGWAKDLTAKDIDLDSYQRTDQSTFMLKKVKDVDSRVSEYYYFDVAMGKNGVPVIRRAALLSESKLEKIKDPELRNKVANILLSRQRLKRKIAHARGYVGYIGTDQGLYYDRDFELDQLHLIEHAL